MEGGRDNKENRRRRRRDKEKASPLKKFGEFEQSV